MSAALDKAASMAAHAASVGVAGKGLPPVHLWNPAHCGEIDIRIARDGRWFHEGRPIEREAMVRLFSTILRSDPDGFHLVTPVEKLRIQVDDAPFVAVRLDASTDVLSFTTNVGDVVEAGPEHPLRIEADPQSGEPSPYVLVRAGLEARLNRPVFFELASLAEARGDEFYVRSNGAEFRLGRAA